MSNIIYDMRVINEDNINDEINNYQIKLKFLYNNLGEDCNLKVLEEIEEIEILLRILRRNIN